MASISKKYRNTRLLVYVLAVLVISTNTLNAATITGQLKDVITGQPIVGLEDQIGVSAYLEPSSWQVIGTGTIDTNGTYRIEELPVGSYYLHLGGGAGYEQGWYVTSTELDYYWGNAQIAATLTAIDSVASGIDITIGKTGSVAGSLIDATTGQSIVRPEGGGIDIDFRLSPCGSYFNHTDIAENGSYQKTGLPPGTYYMNIGPYGSANYIGGWYVNPTTVSSNCNDAQPAFTITPEAEVTDIDITLQKGGIIAGQILENQNPIVLDEDTMWVNAYTGDACEHYEYASRSDVGTDGVYELAGLSRNEEYLLKTNSSIPYLNEWFSGFDSEGNPTSSTNCVDAKTVSFDNVDQVDNVSFDLEKGAVLEGLVQDGDSNPISNMCVHVFDEKCEEWDESLVDSGNTGTDGQYYTVVPADRGYYVYVNSNCNTSVNFVSEYWDGNGNSGSINCEGATLTGNTSVTTPLQVDFTLDPGGIIKGIVYDGQNPITLGENAMWIETFTGDACEDHEYVTRGDVDATGNYELSGLPLSEDVLLKTRSNDAPYIQEWFSGFDEQNNPSSSPDCGDAVKISFNEAAEIMNASFYLDEAAIIKGRIVTPEGDSEVPVHDVCIDVLTDSCNEYESSIAGYANSDEDGVYSVFVAPGAQYYVKVNPDCSQDFSLIEEYWDGEEGTTECDQAVKLEQTATVGSPITDINFNLAPGATIRGTLLDADGPIDGSQYQIGVDLFEDSSCDNHHYYSSEDMQENGTYEFSGINPAGTYFIQTYINDAPYLPRWFAGFDDNNNPISSENCDDAHPITFDNGSIEQDMLDIYLEKGGVIKGEVLDYEGNPIEDACINVFTQNCGDWNDIEVSSTRTGEDGNYSAVVPPGRGYFLRADPRCSNENPNLAEYWTGFSPEEGSMECDQATETPEVTIGSPVQGINFDLSQGAYIEGRITLVNDPLEDSCIDVFEGSCGNLDWVANGNSESNGDYSVVVPFGGEYYLKTNVDCGDHELVDQYWAGEGNAGSYSCDGAVKLTTPQGTETLQADFQLSPSQLITGTVTDEISGQPVGNIAISAQINKCENDMFLSRTTTVSEGDDKGTYSLLVPEGLDVFIQTCVRCDSDNSYIDLWYPNISERECQNAVAVTSPDTGIDFELPADSDGDGLSDNEELNKYLTNPNNPDSDGDGIDDWGEVYLWGDDFDGNIDSSEDSIWNIHEVDADNDGVSDLQELARGGDFKDPNVTPADLILYDDFSSGSIDETKWRFNQYAIETDSGALRLFVDSPVEKKVAANLQTTTANKIKTTFTVEELAKYADDETGLFYSLLGVFYSTSTDANSVIGKVYSSIYFGDRGNGPEVWYTIYEALDEDWNSNLIKEGVVVAAGDSSLALGSQYTTELIYNGVNGFTYSIYTNDGTEINSISDVGPSLVTSIDKHLSPRVYSPESGGRVLALVSSVEIDEGTGTYEVVDNSFETSPLSSSSWTMNEEVTEVTDDGKLKLLTHSYGNKITTRANLTKRYNYIETKVTFNSTKQVTNPETISRARIAGYLYNDTRGPGSVLPYNGYEGNVWGQIFIEYSEPENTNEPENQGFRVVAGLERTMNADDTEWDNIDWEELDLPFEVEFDKEYILYIGFAGDFIIFGISSPTDENKHAIFATDIETSMYLPYKGSLGVHTRVYGNGSEVLQMAHFDDIRVSGEPLEKAGDLNVDGNVDLQDAILGLQALTNSNVDNVWMAGDVDGDQVIGLPEVIEIMDNYLAP